LGKSDISKLENVEQEEDLTPAEKEGNI